MLSNKSIVEAPNPHQPFHKQTTWFDHRDETNSQVKLGVVTLSARACCVAVFARIWRRCSDWCELARTCMSESVRMREPEAAYSFS